MCLYAATGGRPKSTKKIHIALDEEPKPLVGGYKTLKRKRKEEVEDDDDDDDDEAAGVSDVQDKPPPVKRARKTAGGKPGTTKAKVDPPAPLPAPPRDSQVLKKVRPRAKKNANYGGRAKVLRTSSPACRSPALSDDFPDDLELKILPVGPRVEPPLMDDGTGDCTSSPPAPPKPKPKSKAAAKPKSILTEKVVVPTEKPKAATMKTKAKTQTGTRTRAAATKSKDADDTEIVKKGPPQKAKAKAKAKRKPEVTSADEGEGKKGGEGKLELAENSPAVIEVLSSPPEPPKAILPKRNPISRVTPKEVFIFNSLHCVHASLRSANRS